jgi:hypothetical protein
MIIFDALSGTLPPEPSFGERESSPTGEPPGWQRGLPASTMVVSLQRRAMYDRTASGGHVARKVLLACRIAASLLYVAMNGFVPMQYEGYSSASQTVSELSALDAPTRSLWVALGLAYTLLSIAFGCGVWASARRNHFMRLMGGLIVVNGGMGLDWPPMHQRAVLAAGGGSLTDTMHLVWGAVTFLIMAVTIGLGGAALGRRFQLFLILTIVILAVFAALTGLDAPRVSANLPTPWIGIWERISIGAYLLWVIVLAIVLLRIRDTSPEQRAQA